MAGFAGSHRLDERRRRRWAVEQDASQDSESNSELLDEEESSTEAATLEIPIANFVPVAIWKYIATGLLLAVLVTGMLQADAILLQWFALENGALRAFQQRTVTVFGGLCLLAAGQLSLLIRCIRGRSRTDFDGRYRIWSWATAGFSVAGLAVLLDIGVLLSEITIPLPWRPTDVVGASIWRVPVIILGGAFFLRMRRELRDARPTFAMWNLTAGCYALAIAFNAGLITPVGSAITTATAMIGHGMLLVTLLWHTRHVVHINPEPATSVVPQFRLWIPRLRFPSLRMPSFRKLLPRRKKKKAKTLTAAMDSVSEKAPTTVEPVVADPVIPATSEATVQDEPLPKPNKTRKTRVEPAHVAPEPKLSSPEPEAPRQPEATPDSDKPVSADELKGLSKKQRRQLRKQRREAQRNSQSR